MSDFKPWLSSLEDGLFWTEDRRPDYKGILFLWAANLYPDGTMPIGDIVSPWWPNPSSFQRWVSKEARRRDNVA